MLAKPTGLSLRAGNETLTLTWRAPQTPVAHFIRWREAGKTAWLNPAQFSFGTVSANGIFISGGTHTYEMTGLTNGTRYEVQLTASAAGASPAWTRAFGTPSAQKVYSLGFTIHIRTDGTPTQSPVVTEGDAIVMVVRLDADAPPGNLVFSVSASHGSGPTAASAADVGTVPSSVTVTAGDREATLTITTVDDALDEPAERFTVTATTSTTGWSPKSTGANSATVTIVDNDLSSAANLSALTLTDDNGQRVGGFIPALRPFNPRIRSYTATVANTVTGVTVTPTAATAGATITVDGTVVASGTASGAITLDVGANTITIVVTSGGATRTYVVTVTRRGNKVFSIADVEVPEGDEAVLTVTLGAPAPPGGLGFSVATAYGTGASDATSADVGTVPSTVTVAANATSATLTIPTAEDTDEESDETFTVTISTATAGWTAASSGANRATVTIADDDRPPADAALSALTLTGRFNTAITLSPSFAPATLTYTGLVENDITRLTVTPTVRATGKATVTVDGSTVASGVASTAINLVEGANTITIVVTAEDGATTRTYRVTVTRQAGKTFLIRDATVTEGQTAQLLVVLGEGAPASPLLSFTVATEFGSGAGFAVAADVGSVQTPLTLRLAGTRAFNVSVPTVDDAEEEPTETLTVTVATSTPGWDPAASGAGSATLTINDNDAPSPAVLSALALADSGGQAVTLSPAFASDGLSYTATVANAVTSVTVTPTVKDTGYAGTVAVTVNGVSVASGTASGAVTLNEGANTIPVVVTADNGETQTYRVVVTRQGRQVFSIGDVAVTEGDDAVLTVTLGTAPSGNLAFTVSDSYGSGAGAAVAADVGAVPATVTVTAGATSASLTIPTIDDSDTEGDETFTVTIATSTSGWTAASTGANSATVTINDNDLSADADLSALTLSGGGQTVALTPAFAAATLSYAATVAQAVTSVTVTPTVSDTGKATVTVNGTPVDSGVASTAITVAEGATTITIVVTAEDATTTKSYQLTVTRQTVLGITLDTPEREYGATDDLSYSVTGLATGDTAAQVLTGSLARAAGDDAGSYTINFGDLAITSTYAATYALPDVSTLGSYTVTPKVVTVAPAVLTREYDGGTALDGAVLSGGEVTGEVGAESLTLSVTGGAYASADVGTGITIDNPVFALVAGANTNAANYAVPDTVDLTGTITVKTITAISGVTVVARTAAAGNTDATFDTGLAAGDGVADADLADFRGGGLQVSGSFPSDQIGTHDVTVTYTLQDSGRFNTANYVLAGGADTDTLPGTLHDRPTLTVTPTTVTRGYGEPEPTEFAFEVSGDFEAGDSAATTFFTTNPLSREDDGTHDAGSYAFVLADPLPYAAGIEARYAFILAPGVVYTITPRPITAISGVTVVSRGADGTTDAEFDTSLAVGAGVLDAEVADFRDGGLVVAGAFPSPDAGTHAVDVTYSLAKSGSFTAGNYALAAGVETATLSGTLTALATLTITPTTVTRGYGEPEPAVFAYTVSGPFAAGDSAATAFFTTNPLSREDSGTHDAGTYAFVLADPLPYAAGKEHYAFNLAPGVAYTITPRAITAISGVTVVSRAADGTTDAAFDTSLAVGAGVLDAEVADFRAGGLVVAGAFPEPDAGTHDVDVTYSLTDSGSFTADNYALDAGAATATLSGTLTASGDSGPGGTDPRPTLTITPTTVTRTYGEPEPAEFAFEVSGPFADGDSAATTFFTTNPLSREDDGTHDAGSYAFVLADPLPYAAGIEARYAFILAPGVVYAITPRPITAISGVTVVSRAADGTTDATFDTSRAVGAGVLDAEVADFRAGGLVVAGAFPEPDAGTHDVDVTYSLTDSGSFTADNYALDAGAATATLSGTLTASGDSGPGGTDPRPTLTITPTTVTRTYGEPEPAEFAFEVSGDFEAGDSASTAFFTTNPVSREDDGTHDAGSYAFVLADPLPYAAGIEARYAFILAPGVVYTITARPITAISGVTVVSRAADGTTDAAFDTSLAAGAGVLDPEVADFRDGGLVVTGRFPASAPGTYRLAVTYSLADRGGFKADNYRMNAGVATAALSGTLTAGDGSGPRLGCKPKSGVPAARVVAAGTLRSGTLAAATADGAGASAPHAVELALPLAENLDGSAQPVLVGCVALQTAGGRPYDRYAITADDEQRRFAVDRDGMLRYVGSGENHERTPERFVTVSAVPGDGPAADLRVRVEITDVNEPGVVSLSARQPRIGETLTATLADEDAGVRDARWQWRRRTPGGAWTAIAGAAAADYAPAAADAGHLLQARVTYADTHGAQRAASAPTGMVAPRERMLQAALAGLGRTAAAAAVDVIGQRFAPATLQAGAPDRLGVDLILNRRALHAPEAGDAAARGRLARTLTEALGVRVTPDGVSYAPASGAELLAGSAFSAQQGHGAGRWGVWGSGDYRRFDGAVDGFTQAGSVLSGWLGADYRFAANALAGLAASYGSLHLDSTSAAHTEGNATLTGWLAHAYPYGLWMPEPWLGFWGIAGLGTGNATLAPKDGGAGTTGDLRAWLGAAGQRVELASVGGLSLAAKADGFVTGLTARGGLPPVDSHAWRARLLLEGGLEWRPPDGRLAALVEVGGRLDGGDAEHGLGVEVGAQVSYTHTGSGLGVSGRGRLLLAHEQGVRDWGASAALRWQPGGAGAGPALSVTPAWGAARAAAASWLPDSVALRFGYVLLPAAGSRVRPYAEVGLRPGGGVDDYRFGLEGSLEY